MEEEERTLPTQSSKLNPNSTIRNLSFYNYLFSFHTQFQNINLKEKEASNNAKITEELNSHNIPLSLRYGREL